MHSYKQSWNCAFPSDHLNICKIESNLSDRIQGLCERTPFSELHIQLNTKGGGFMVPLEFTVTLKLDSVSYGASLRMPMLVVCQVTLSFVGAEINFMSAYSILRIVD